ncbi:MAG TPA: 2-phospho-L-lactate guanylyltransferase [Mycobacteriales bacterium]|nr:2-phospho-L-lactate guanylyltransferase [Mycobacteriales bacterium]
MSRRVIGVAVDALWVVIVPVKELHLAKSRLHELSDQRRVDLALAMAADVVSAAAAAASVRGVVVVTNDARAAALTAELGARVIADASDSGLDDALVDAARTARSVWPRCGLVAVSSDLPCATPTAIDTLVRRAGTVDRGVLADRRGDGTTVLTAGPTAELTPSYGAASRARHVLGGATQLDASGLESLCLDVDTPSDLADALSLGVGPHTSAVMLRADT